MSKKSAHRWARNQMHDERKPEDYPMWQRVLAWAGILLFLFILAKAAIGF
jgi:hypothetical protein